MTRTDKKILKFSIGSFIIISILGCVPLIFIFKASFDQISTGLYSSFIITCILTGILVYMNYRKRAIIPTKKIIGWFAKFAIAIAPGLTAIIYFSEISTNPDPNISIGTPVFFFMIFVLFIIMFLIVFLILFIILIFALGMIGLLSAAIRGITPQILLHVSRITPNVIDTAQNPDSKMPKVYSFLSWLYCTPEELDSRTLRINRGKPVKHYPWSSLKKAMLWQFLFGVVVIIYISLNPLYLGSMSFQRLFNIASNATTFIPFIIIPWFIFLRLDARIKGFVRDYKLYDGIVYRMYRTVVTLGTILIIIRLGLQSVDPMEVLQTFSAYFVMLLGTTFILSFVYFNYFENGLAWKVAKRYRKIKD